MGLPAAAAEAVLMKIYIGTDTLAVPCPECGTRTLPCVVAIGADPLGVSAAVIRVIWACPDGHPEWIYEDSLEWRVTRTEGS